MIILDASAIIALRNPDDAHHDAARRAFEGRSDQRFRAPTTVYSEVLVQPLRLHQAAAEAAQAFFTRWIDLVPLDQPIAHVAAEVRARSRLRLPDAIVIATGIELDAAEVLTFDQRWAGVDRRVHVLA